MDEEFYSDRLEMVQSQNEKLFKKIWLVDHGIARDRFEISKLR